MVIFREVLKGVQLACDEDHVGHIAVVGHVDLAGKRVLLFEQNVNRAPRALSLLEPPSGAQSPWRIDHAGVVGWMRHQSVDARSCGVRFRLHNHGTGPDPAGESERTSQLIGCDPGAFCDVDSGRCQPIAVGTPSCDSAGQVCAPGTRCDGQRCVCDERTPRVESLFRFEESTQCWRPGPYVQNADGCSASIGLRSDPAGVKALYLRDLHTDDPMLLSPPLDLVTKADHEVQLVLSCRGLPGQIQTSKARVFLSRSSETPEFDVN